MNNIATMSTTGTSSGLGESRSSCRLSPMPTGPGASSGTGFHIKKPSRAHTSSPAGSSRSEHPLHQRHLRTPTPLGSPGSNRLASEATSDNSRKWIHKLCHEPGGDADTCCLGFWSPCTLYGKTQYRLNKMSLGEDPLDLTEFKDCNNTCCNFCGLMYTGFAWTAVMMQHSRIRATYNIDGANKGDCVQAYFCRNCTLMQDEREVCARERQSAEAKVSQKKCAIQSQPSPQPEMRYAAPHFYLEAGSEPALHRPSLSGPNTSTQQTAMTKNGKTNGTESENEQDRGHSKCRKKLHEDPKTKINGSAAGAEGGESSNHALSEASSDGKKRSKSLSPIGSALNRIVKGKLPHLEGKDAILASRQPWRGQKPNAEQNAEQDADYNTAVDRASSSPSQHTLATCRGDGTKGVDDQDQATTQHTLFECARNEAASHVEEGKFLEKHAVGDCCREGVSMGDGPGTLQKEVSVDEAVIIYYDDAERPQRHRLVDCARLRASTLGRADTPHNDCTFTGCLGGGIVNSTDKSGNPERNHLTECVEFKPAGNASQSNIFPRHRIDDLQYCVDNLPQNGNNDTGHAKPRQATSLQHSLNDCAGDGTAATTDIEEQVKNNLEAVQQHPLTDCVVDGAQTMAKQEQVQQTSQYDLAECAQIKSAINSLESITPGQNDIAQRVGYEQSLEAAADSHGIKTCTASIPAAKQTENDIKTAPGIVVPTITVSAENLTEHIPTGAKTSEILMTAPNSKISKEHQLADCATVEEIAGISGPGRQHDGALDKQHGRQPSQATAALRKILSDANTRGNATGYGPQGKFESELTRGAGEKKQRYRGRGRGGRGRGKRARESSSAAGSTGVRSA